MADKKASSAATALESMSSAEAAARTAFWEQAVNVKSLANSRLLEIKNIQSSIAAQSGTRRVFQILPRSMRRRAMSHNPHLLPKKMRRAGKAEIERMGMQRTAEDLKRKKKRHSHRNAKKLLSAEAQEARTFKWMETHVWHAKRFKLTPIWGYKVPLHANTKCLKSNLRASRQACTAIDLSYYGHIQLDGPQNTIISTLQPLLAPNTFTHYSMTYLQGQKEGELLCFDPALTHPKGCIGPVRFLWKPLSSSSSSSAASSSPVQASNLGEKRKISPQSEPEHSKKPRSASSTSSSASPIPAKDCTDERSLLLWIHPAIFTEIWNALNSSITSASASSSASSSSSNSVKITDLRQKLIRFELVGPKTISVLRSVFKIDVEKTPAANQAVWEQLSHITSLASLPPGVALSLSIQDPRVAFPPKHPDFTLQTPAGDSSAMSQLLTQWPQGLACSDEIWTDSLRSSITSSMAPDHAINALKRYKNRALLAGNAAAIPARSVPPTFEPIVDKKKSTKTHPSEFGEVVKSIPVLLIQRPSPPKCAYGAAWTVTVPAGYGMSLWRSFMFAGAKPIGLRDRDMQFMDQGIPCFPLDFPDTKAHVSYAAARAAVRQTAHEMRPPNKRVNFDAIHTVHPFSCRFDLLTATDRHLFDRNLESELKAIQMERIKKIGKRLLRSLPTASKLKLKEARAEKKKQREEEEKAKQQPVDQKHLDDIFASFSEAPVSGFPVQAMEDEESQSEKNKAKAEAAESSSSSTSAASSSLDAKNKALQDAMDLSAESTLITHPEYCILRNVRSLKDLAAKKSGASSSSSSLPVPDNKSLLLFKLDLKHKGLPEECSVLYAPTDADFALYSKSSRDFGGVEEPLTAPSSPFRHTIGYLHSGMRSLLTGHGLGFCCIRTDEALALFAKQKRDRLVVLLRCPSSRCYRAAEIELVS